MASEMEDEDGKKENWAIPRWKCGIVTSIDKGRLAGQLAKVTAGLATRLSWFQVGSCYEYLCMRAHWLFLFTISVLRPMSTCSS